jgi:hypothetical protein
VESSEVGLLKRRCISSCFSHKAGGTNPLVLSLVPEDDVQVWPTWPVLAFLLERWVQEGISE